MTQNAPLPAAVQDALNDAVACLDRIANSLDFIANGLESHHPGATHLLITVSNEASALEDLLRPLCQDQKAEP